MTSSSSDLNLMTPEELRCELLLSRRQVEARSAELAESLEYQAAIANVLDVISRSPNEVQPVFDVIAHTAWKLCDATGATIFMRQADGRYRMVAQEDPVAGTSFGDRLRTMTLAADRSSVTGRAALEGRTVHIEDIRVDSEFTLFRDDVDDQRRTMLGVPLVRNGRAVGVITLLRTEVRSFAVRQIALVETFAAQALIAIENARLFEAEQTRTKELTESLEYQTATSEVLAVISRSPNALQPVVDSISETAVRLCGADWAFIRTLGPDGQYHAVSFAGVPGKFVDLMLSRTLTPGRSLIAGRALLERRTIHVDDVFTDPDCSEDQLEIARAGQFHTVLAVPLLRAGEPIGIIVLLRTKVASFSKREIDLVNTFADQAVIAIENTRLFEEVQARTKELAKTVEDLEIASQHKNQFVANMSHELRTPLAAILGYAELMQEGFYEPQGPKSLDALTRIRSNGKHLLGLINTVLDIAKIEAGQFTLNMAEYAIEGIVETVRSATESLAQNKKLALTTEVPKSLPIGLGDEQRLTQVLLNLVGNAIKFTDAGEVRVTAKAVNGHFNVTVADTGPGIPPAEQTRIFEQFHQVDSSLTKAKGGTGLGLAIARQIVEMHGGRIWVESTVGKGSTFQMEIPSRAEFRKRAL